MQWNKIQYKKLTYNPIQSYSTNKHAHNITLPLIVHFNIQQTNPIMSQAATPSAPASQALSTVPLHVAPPEVAQFPLFSIGDEGKPIPRDWHFTLFPTKWYVKITDFHLDVVLKTTRSPKESHPKCRFMWRWASSGGSNIPSVGWKQLPPSNCPKAQPPATVHRNLGGRR